MEAVLMYLVVLAALGLMLAGAYGAMPLLVRRQGASEATAGGPSFVIGGATPLVQPELRTGFRAGPRVRVLEAEIEPEEPRAVADHSRPFASVADTEALLTSLFDEVDMLRTDLERLRTELAALIDVAGGRPNQARRPRTGPAGSLPSDLRRQVSDARSERRIAGA